MSVFFCDLNMTDNTQGSGVVQATDGTGPSYLMIQNSSSNDEFQVSEVGQGTASPGPSNAMLGNSSIPTYSHHGIPGMHLPPTKKENILHPFSQKQNPPDWAVMGLSPYKL